MPDHKEKRPVTECICNEFDALLADIDGRRPERRQARRLPCARKGLLGLRSRCSLEAEAGRNWLKGLTEVEPPAGLVENVLASTTGIDKHRLRLSVLTTQPRVSWLERVQAWALA